MSVDEVRLWRDVLEEQFGTIVSKVATYLIRRGRQPLPFLVRGTGLEATQIRESLVVLIQHRVVCHYTLVEGGKPTTYYQVRSSALLDRLQIGIVAYYATQWFGNEGGAIIKEIIVNGMLTLHQVIHKIAGNRPKLEQQAEITTCFTKMLGERFLIAVHAEDAQIKYDRDVLADEQKLDKISALPTAKQLAEVQLERRVREEEELRSGNVKGLKRKLPSDMDDMHAITSKKHHGDGSGGVSSNTEVEENTYFSINFERFNIRLRNQQIVRYFVERINRTAGAVMKTLLALVEPQIYSLKDARSIPKSLIQIAHHMPNNVDVTSAIVFDDHYSGRVRPRNELISEMLDIMVADVSGILARTDSRGGGEYTIFFDKVLTMQKRKAIESVTLEHFGNAACRILKLLCTRGKMDERQVSRLVMLPMKDTREFLQALSLHGFAELQEVPKSADRAPARTFFLWYVPIDKCYRALQRNTLRTLANIRQRRHEEREKHGALLAKSDRLDVKENASLLSESEHTMLRELQATLYRLGRAEMDLVELIITLQ